MSAALSRTGVEGGRLGLRVRGAVQGVGFRPFAYALARRLELGGHVMNDAEGVRIEIEGTRVEEFLGALRAEAPRLARIDTVEVETLARRGETGFEIRASQAGVARTRIPADAAICEACEADLADASGRFHRYPFVNCTHCGPRFTLTRRLPYDRAQTSMARFAMCEDCALDYADPANRRFHAEPIACARCGPRLSHDVAEIADALARGRIVALKGIGGYHLVCDARSAALVSELRRRKRRDAKPFAVMVADFDALDALALASEAERALLASPAHPIVLVESRGVLPEAVAPGLNRIGVVLPYAPLHRMLFDALPQGAVLIATSANPGGAPLIHDDAEARAELADIADLIVSHDREIVTRADDSVIAVIDGAPAFIRRARGYVPDPIDLGVDGPCVLACGAQLKTTVTVTRGREAFVSQHIGDLSGVATARFYRETAAHLIALLDVRPEAAACDLHPDFFSTRFAEETGLPLIGVQHHAAHVAAVAAEHGVEGPILGVSLDGYGYGDDAGAWGGELMLVEGAAWRRLGHLSPLALPGGDRAAAEPWRMGVAALAATGRLDRAGALFAREPGAGRLAEALARSARGSDTTSLGRLFDAAAALLGICQRQAYEGDAAMRLEALVEAPRLAPGLWRLENDVLDFRPLLAWLIDARPSPREGAALFHGVLAEGLAAWIAARAAPGTQVALSGGCMMNRILAEDLAARLRAVGLKPLLPRLAPANDGGLSLGQAALARARLGC